MLLKIERKNHSNNTGWLYFEVDSLNVEVMDVTEFFKLHQISGPYLLHKEMPNKVVKVLYLYQNSQFKEFVVIGKNHAYLCGNDGKTLDVIN